ncbi:MAG: hypothetical protein AAB500_02590 [Patescibacteria group bacterium]
MSSNIRKILKLLAEKPAIPVETLKDRNDPKASYALARTARALVTGGYVEMLNSSRESYLRLTKKGKTRLDTIRLEGDGMPVAQNWDGKWRIIILDIDEARKSEREALRYLLKKANFVCVKNTVWISHLPYEHLFENIKKDLGLTTELMILVTDNLDPETRLAFLEALKK